MARRHTNVGESDGTHALYTIFFDSGILFEADGR